jgi:hypothetical protein
VNFGVATGSSQDRSGGGQWVVVPYGVLARRGSCRERCLIDSGGIEGDYYGSGILVRGRVELAVKARGVGGCRCSSREFLRGSMGSDRREI